MNITREMLAEFREDWVFFPEIIALIDLAEKGLEAKTINAQLTVARADIARLREALEAVKRAAVGGASYQAFKSIANNALAETEPKL